MTKHELIKFIESRYGDDEQLVWQIVCKDDVEAYAESPIDDQKWSDFVDYTERYSTLADPFSENAVEQFQDFEVVN